MGGTEATEQLFWGTLEDTSGASQGLARGGAEGGGGKSSGGGSRGKQSTRGGRYIGGGVDGDQEGADKIGEGGGPGEGGFMRGSDDRRSHVAGGGTDPQGENGISQYRPSEGGVEGSGGDYKSPAHSLHHLPRLPPCLPGRSLIRHLHP